MARQTARPTVGLNTRLPIEVDEHLKELQEKTGLTLAQLIETSLDALADRLEAEAAPAAA